jgi:hypothetical protein
MLSLLADLPNLSDVAIPAVIFSLVVVSATIYKIVFALGDYEKSGLPLAGEPDGKKSFTFRTRLRYYYDCAALYTDAYYRVSQQISSFR